MAFRPPDESDLAAVAERYGLDLSSDDVASFAPFATGLLGSWTAVEELYARTAPAPRTDRAVVAPDRRRQPARRVVRDDRDPGGRRRPAGRADGGDQGQHHGRRRADDERLGDAWRASCRPATRPWSPACWPPARRSPGRRSARTCASPAAATRRAPGRCATRGTRPARPAGRPAAARRSSRRAPSTSPLGGDQGGSVRIPSAYSGTVGHKPTHGLVPYTGAFPIELTHRPPRPDHPHRRRRRPRARRARRRRRPRPPPAAGRPRRRLHGCARRRRSTGLRVGVVDRGVRHPRPVAARRRRRRAGGDRAAARAPGCAVADVSVPWHRDAMHVWNVIATEGATAQMVDGNAYGMNYQGLYDPELIAHYGRQWRERAARFSETVKLVVLAGRYAIDTGYGQHYAMARNLAYELRQAYDDALADHDVLVMPTLPLTATVIPGRRRPARGVHRPGAGDDRQHRPVRRHRAPGDVGAGRAGRRAPGRADDRRPALRRRHLPARGPRLRAGRRRVPGPAGRPPPSEAGHERRPRSRRHRRPRPGASSRRTSRSGTPSGRRRRSACSRSRSRAGFFGVDQFRYGIEQMHPAEYLASRYYEHWVHTAEHYTTEAGRHRPGRDRAPHRSTTSSIPTSRCPTRRTPSCWRSSTPR